MNRIVLGSLFIFFNLFPYFSNCQGIFLDSTDEFTFERVLITEKTNIVSDSFIYVQFGKRIHNKTYKTENALFFGFSFHSSEDWEGLSEVILLCENNDTLLFKGSFDTLNWGNDLIYLIPPNVKSFNSLSQIPVKKIRFNIGDINRDYEIINRRVFINLIHSINDRIKVKGNIK